MKTFVAIAVYITVATAKPSGLYYSALPAIPTAYYATVPAQSQYHAQDSLGQYSYGYSDGLSRKQEIKSFDGITRGSYSYVDAEGKLQTVDYTADAINGFRATGTNLPKALPQPEQAQPEPVSDTVEVAQAKVAHMAAIEEAKKLSSEPAMIIAEKTNANVELPKPVEDTLEVAQAKAAHFAAKKEAEIRNSIAPSTTVEYAPAFYTTGLASYPFHYSAKAAYVPASYAYRWVSPVEWNSPRFETRLH